MGSSLTGTKNIFSTYLQPQHTINILKQVQANKSVVLDWLALFLAMKNTSNGVQYWFHWSMGGWLATSKTVKHWGPHKIPKCSLYDKLETTSHLYQCHNHAWWEDINKCLKNSEFAPEWIPPDFLRNLSTRFYMSHTSFNLTMVMVGLMFSTLLTVSHPIPRPPDPLWGSGVCKWQKMAAQCYLSGALFGFVCSHT